MTNIQVNYVAILVCAVASMVVGYFWYSKMLFGKQWMRLSGITEADINKGKDKMPVTYGTMFVASLVMAYVLAHFISFANAVTITDGIMTAFWAWLGFVATTFLSGSLFEGKPIKLYYIQAGHYLVSMAVMGAILVSL